MSIAKIFLTLRDNEKKFRSAEWLDTDGTGGYASSSLDHCHTRKYHGLLVANLKHPPGRYVLLSKYEDSLVIGEEEFYLSCHQYPGCSFPPGPSGLTGFCLNCYPRFLYELNGTRITKSILALPGENCTLMKYEFNQLPAPGILRLKPLLAFRGYHELAAENRFIKTKAEIIPNGFRIEPYDGLPELFITTSIKSAFQSLPLWYYNFLYDRERERGYSFQEDLFQPGIIEVPVRTGTSVIVSASLDTPKERLTYRWSKEVKRREREAAKDMALLTGHDDEDMEYLQVLFRSARQFLIIAPDKRPAIIAGYHWFTDWGRDTLIALPGLTFCLGRLKEGTAILTQLAKQERHGLLPNFFSEDGRDNPYNTVDSSLWFFWSCQELLSAGGNLKTIREELWPVMKKIIRAFLDGTRFNIHVTDQGLLWAGAIDTHLTWMDAVVSGKPVTPRFGCAVEINALWYNALCFARELDATVGEGKLSLDGLIDKTQKAFIQTFWLAEEGYLADVHAEGRRDRAIRPNQLLAVSLPYSPLDTGQARAVVETVTKHLLTPFGLRTLAASDPHYQGAYQGGPAERDGAYHQGTVWPWLIGHWGEASLKVAEDRDKTKKTLRAYLRNLLKNHLPEAGVGGISEIFSGDAPHEPNGCISQAWSLAEIIRLYSLLRG